MIIFYIVSKLFWLWLILCCDVPQNTKWLTQVTWIIIRLSINIYIDVCMYYECDISSDIAKCFVASSQLKRSMKMSISSYLTYSESHYLWLFGYHLLFACIHLMNKNIDNKNPNNILNIFGLGIWQDFDVQRNKIYSWNKLSQEK